MRRPPTLIIYLLLLTLAFARDVKACSRVVDLQVVNPSAAATDKVPPSAPPAVVASIVRGKAPQRSGGTFIVSSCDDLGLINLRLTAQPADEGTSPGEFGFSWRHLSGTLPDQLNPSAEFVKGGNGNDHPVLSIVWHDGATNEQERLDFSIALLVRDAAGNISESGPIHVSDPGRSGDGCH